MKLRSGTSFWPSRHRTISYPPLQGDAQCRVLVLGGGVTGALVAYRLVQCGLSVILLDKHEIGLGSTAASTGLLQYEVDTPLLDLIKTVGEKHAVHAYRRGLRAIDEIEQLVEEIGDPCDFVRRDSLYFASSLWHYRRVKREYACLRQFEFDVDFLTREQLSDISSIRAPCALRSRGDAEIDPYRFTQRLIESAAKKGLVVHTRTTVDDVRESDREVIARTAEGTVRADAVVYATGYDSQPYLDRTAGSFHSTYALVSQPGMTIPGWPDRCLLWETSRPYFYARWTSDGRAMIGGGDTRFSNDHERDGLVDRKIEELTTRFQALFPEVTLTPEYAWAGTFAETKDGLAFIGRPHDRPRAYFALGYGGNGITFSVIAARVTADLIIGRDNIDAEVFRFGR